MRLRTSTPKLLATFLTLVFVASSLLPIFSQKSAAALSGSQFKAGRIIDDSVFYDYRSMTASQIQNFLNAKVPSCSSGHTCLKNYKANTPNVAAESGICNNIIGHTGRLASEIIYDVSRACGVSPKSMLVLLQKEQGLVLSTAPTSYMYKFATGFCVYDTTPPPACSGTSGFFNQVYYAARQFKKYKANPTNYNFVAGRTNRIYYNPDASCGYSNVYIENQATAGLYNYTPYQPNKATLSVGLGQSAPCGAYGNKNFWWYFNIWFGSTYGTPFFQVIGSDPVYIQGANNTYYHVTSYNELKAYGYGTKVSYIAKVASSYKSGWTYKGDLPSIARYEGSEIYLINYARSHHFPDQTMLNTYGYVLGDEAQLPSWEINYLIHSTDVESVMKQVDRDEIYLVSGGKKKHIIDPSAYNTLGSPTYSSQPSVTLDSSYARQLPTGAPIMTAGSFVRNSSTGTYSIWNGSTLQPFSTSAAQSIGLPLNYSAPSSELNQLTTSGTTVGKLAKNSGGTLYILDYKKKFTVTSGQLANLGLNSSSFVTTDDTFLQKFSTSSMQSLVKINGGSSVYSIINGKLYHVYSMDDFVGLGYSWSNIVNINNTSKSLFTNNGNDIFEQRRLVRVGSTDSVYLIDGSFTKKLIPNPSVFSNYGYKMRNVVSTSSSGLAAYTTSGNLAQVVKDSSNVYWLVDLAHRHKISATMLGASYYNINTGSVLALSDANINAIATSSDLTEQIKATDSNKVYKVQNGQKHWFTTPSSFSANGGDWSKVILLSPSYVASIPTGSSL